MIILRLPWTQDGNAVTGNADNAKKWHLDAFDDTSYLKSQYTETEVHNLFDYADANCYYDEKQVTYLSENYGQAAIESIGKPAAITSEGSEGVSQRYKVDDGDIATGYAANTLTAASWNEDIQRRYGEFVGEDALFAGVHTIPFMPFQCKQKCWKCLAERIDCLHCRF